MIDPAAQLDFVEHAPHEKGFAEHFDRQIRPKLMDMEARRLSTVASTRRRALWAVPAALAIAGASVWLVLRTEWATAGVVFVLVLVGVAGVGLFLWATHPKAKYAENRKELLVREILKFASDFSYEPDGRIPEDILKSSKQFGTWSSYSGSDLIKGTHDQRPFMFAKVDLEKSRGMHLPIYATVFKGLCITVGLPAPTQHLTVAVTHSGPAKRRLRSLRRGSGLERVTFEDATFESKFDVYASNEAEARRLITRELMDTALDLGRLWGATSVEFGFDGELFLVKIWTDRDDLFQPVTAKASALTTQDSRKFLEELDDVLRITEAVAKATVPI